MSTTDKLFLIAGLGNPGSEYSNNRHNIGYMAANQIADILKVEFRRIQQKALVTKGFHGNNQIILVKPRTFMNLSGQSVGPLIRYYRIPLENALIIYDDVDLPFETIRLKPDGSSSGQKGMNSIIKNLGTDQIPRLRIGIGRPPGRLPTPSFVLQDFSNQEQEFLPFLLERAANAALTFVNEGINEAMNRFNQRPNE